MKFWIIFAILVIVVFISFVFACFKVFSDADIAAERDLKDTDKDIEYDEY